MNLTCTIKLEVKIASQIAAEIGIKRKRALQQSVSILFKSKESWSLQQSRRLIKPLKSSKPKLLDQSILGSLYDSGKLPTYPSPKPTSTLTSLLGQNVGLGEGQVVLHPQTEFPSESAKTREKDCTWAFGGQFAALSLVNPLFICARVVKARCRH